MAKIDVKTTWDGEGVELEDVNLEQITNRDLILQMIESGVIVPESQLPSVADHPDIMYNLIDKAGVKVELDEVKTLAELGFTDGDTIQIVTTSYNYGQQRCITLYVDGVSYVVEDIDLDNSTTQQLISDCIKQGVLPPLVPLAINGNGSDVVTHCYELMDRNGQLIVPSSNYLKTAVQEGGYLNVVRTGPYVLTKAETTVCIAWTTGERIGFVNVNLENVTSQQLINLIGSKYLQDNYDMNKSESYCILDRNLQKIPIGSTLSLSKLGFVAGDTIYLAVNMSSNNN